MLELVRGQLAHGAEEAVVAGAGRERADIILQFLGIARLDEAHGHGVAVARAQYVGILPEIIETQRRHGTLHQSLRNCRRPSFEAAPAWLPLRPPERVSRLVSDVAGGNADVVE